MDIVIERPQVMHTCVRLNSSNKALSRLRTCRDSHQQMHHQKWDSQGLDESEATQVSELVSNMHLDQHREST